MKLAVLVTLALALTGTSKPVQLAIVHTVRGCHIWSAARSAGPVTTLELHRGARITIRVSCPMDFRLSQRRGPALALGDPLLHTGTQRTIAFPKRGRYVLVAENVQTSAELGLQTLGADNALRLTVVVR